VRSFVFERLDEVELKGVPEPVEAWLVLDEATIVESEGDQLRVAVATTSCFSMCC
jgi:hypothetical protein